MLAKVKERKKDLTEKEIIAITDFCYDFSYVVVEAQWFYTGRDLRWKVKARLLDNKSNWNPEGELIEVSQNVEDGINGFKEIPVVGKMKQHLYFE